LGHTVNFRTDKEYYKDKRRIKLPPDQWKIFENTQEPIIDEETWKLAQRCRKTIRRTDNKAAANPLTGLMICADCGKRMYNHCEPGGQPYYYKQFGKYYTRSARDYYSCASNKKPASKLKPPCSLHFIRTAAVREIILDTIKNVSGYVRKNEAEFTRQVREASQIRQEAEAKATRKQLNKNEKRHAELDTIISKLYEDNATGKISDQRFETLMAGYEKEQSELAAQTAELKNQVTAFDNDSVRADKFIELTKRYTDFTELTSAMIHEFVEKILVHEPDRSSGRRVQRVDIYLNFIGKFDLPTSFQEAVPEPAPEDMTEEEKAALRRKRHAEAKRRWREKKNRLAAQEQQESLQKAI